MSMRSASLCLVLLMLACGLTSQARVITVDRSPVAAAGEVHATIQSAIDAASDGDTVQVAPGTYSGAGNRDIDFHGKKIIVYSTWQSDSTIIDCGGSSGAHHGGFIFHTGETVDAILQGFTIKNAYFATDGAIDTGAIHCANAGPLIAGCKIVGNSSHGFSSTGAAMPSLYASEIASNTGHGLYMGNSQASRGVVIASQIIVHHNKMTGVVLPWNADSSSQFIYCTITSNDSGGIRLVANPTDPQVVDTVSTFVYATIVAFNRGTGISRTTGFFPGLEVMCTDVFGQTTNWQNVVDATVDTVNCFAVDPMFCDTAGGRYTLLAGSPCLPGPSNPCFTQIGALGGGTCTPTTCCVGMRGNVDCSADNIIDISDLTRLIDYMAISFNPLCCLEEANTDGVGSVDISDLTVLIDHMFISLNPLINCP